MRSFVLAAVIAASLSAAADEPTPGVVRGTVVLEGVKSAGVEVLLSRDNSDRDFDFVERRIRLGYSAVTDSEGRFQFDRVEPGLYGIGVLERFDQRRGMMSMTFSTTNHSRCIAVEPGETQEVTLGGTGRRIAGKVVLPEDEARPVSLLGGTFRRIYTPGSDKEKSDPTYKETAAFRAEYETRAMVMFDLEADGSFSAHDVPPGRYVGWIDVTSDDTARPIGQANFDFTVPEGEYNTPIDLGTVEITMNEEIAKAE